VTAQAGRLGVATKPVVPPKPGNAGGGKWSQFKTDAVRGEGPGSLTGLTHEPQPWAPRVPASRAAGLASARGLRDGARWSDRAGKYQDDALEPPRCTGLSATPAPLVELADNDIGGEMGMSGAAALSPGRTCTTLRV